MAWADVAPATINSAMNAVDRAWSLAERNANSKSVKSDQLFEKALNGVGDVGNINKPDFAFELEAEEPELDIPAPGDPGTVLEKPEFEFEVNVTEPPVQIPTLAEGASIEMFSSWWLQINDALVDNFTWFIDNYFPNECDYLGKAQSWICKTLAEGGTGMAPAVEEQIWQRDRARLLRDSKRATDELLATFASRGFPLPPGAAVAATLSINKDAQDKIAQASRDVAIKQAEIEIENVRFAVENAIKLYTGAIAAAGDFIKALAGTTGNMSQLIPSVTDSQAKLISAASEYYRARISVEELRLKAAMPVAEWGQRVNEKNVDNSMVLINKQVDADLELYKADLSRDEMRLKAALPTAEMEMRTNEKNVDVDLAIIKAKVDAAVAAAQSLGTQAAAALNGLHASASIQGQGQADVGVRFSENWTKDITP